MPVTTVPEDIALSSARLNLIKQWAQRYLDAGKLPGMLVLVARHGEVVFLETFGVRSMESGEPVTEDTIFRIYSMTKPITSVAVMMLYEQGLFQLDEPISRYLPGFTEMEVYIRGEGESIQTELARQPITIHHLLTHTSGLTYGFGNDTPLAELYKSNRTDFNHNDGALAEVVERLCQLPLLFHPGERWGYGVSTDVLARLVEVVSGESFDRFLHDRILQPLRMEDTGFQVPPEKLERLAALYSPTDDGGLELLDAPATSPLGNAISTFSGGAGLASTVGDYFRFTEMLRRKGELDDVRLLGRKTVEYMSCNHLTGDLADMGQPVFSETSFAGIGFGLGFAVMLDPAKAQIMGTPGTYHWGGAASTVFWIDPEEDMSVIFLTQLLPSSTYPIARELRVLTYQALV